MPDSPPRRVVITGAGLVSPLGNSKEELWDALAVGRSGVEPLRSLPTENLPVCYGGEARKFTGAIEDFGPLEKTSQRNIKKNLKVMCREIEMGVAAAQLALTDAGLKAGVYDPDRTGAVYGSDYIMTLPDEFTDAIRKCVGENGQFDFSRWANEGMPEVTPLWLLKYLPNMPASHIAIYNDLRGPNNSITLREAAGNLAIGEAYCTIVRGSADTIVAGATGTRIHPIRTVHVLLQEQMAERDLDPAKACRPFDKDRTGMVVGEGAAAIVLEELETAKARGATILGEVVGQGSSTVITRGNVAKIDEAVKNALVQAMRSSGLSPEDVGHVHAHGLSTQQCDIDEAAGIRAAFGSHDVAVTAAKSYMGNLGAGGSVVELIASVMALLNDRLFPILNYETPDSECPIAGVRSSDAPAGDSFLNVNVTPQGQAAAVAVRKFVA